MNFTKKNTFSKKGKKLLFLLVSAVALLFFVLAFLLKTENQKGVEFVKKYGMENLIYALPVKTPSIIAMHTEGSMADENNERYIVVFEKLIFNIAALHNEKKITNEAFAYVPYRNFFVNFPLSLGLGGLDELLISGILKINRDLLELELKDDRFGKVIISFSLNRLNEPDLQTIAGLLKEGDWQEVLRFLKTNKVVVYYTPNVYFWNNYAQMAKVGQSNVTGLYVDNVREALLAYEREMKRLQVGFKIQQSNTQNMAKFIENPDKIRFGLKFVEPLSIIDVIKFLPAFEIF